MLRNYLSELRLLRHVRHPNIVAFFGAAVDPRSLELVLVFEKIEGSVLTKYIPMEQPDEQQKIQVLLHVAKANDAEYTTLL